MARTKKMGLEYAPQDVNIHTDRKIRRLINEFGGNGYLIYDYIKCLCYKENGYWIGYDDGFCFDVADVLRAGTTENSVLEALKGCFRVRLFDSEVFKASRVITSGGIQKRFLEVRPKAKILPEYLVFKDESTENEDLSTENGTNGTENSDLVHKEKESKVKEMKVAFKLSLEPFRGQYTDAMLLEFLNYWGEADKSMTKLRFQLQPTWELKARLRIWSTNDLKFKK